MKPITETAVAPRRNKSETESRFAHLRACPALVGLIVLVQIGWSAPARAQSGALDLSFDLDGKVTTDFARKADLVSSMAIQADGKIVAAGWATVGRVYRFGVARYNVDGSLDVGFGSGGLVTTVFGGFEDTANAVAIQEDGKIVVAGSTDIDGNLNYRFALARYNTDGSLDTSFGSGGKVMTSTGLGNNNSINALVVQPVSGMIVAAGFGGSSLELRFALTRYDPNGNLDANFGGSEGSSGIVATDFGGLYSSATSVALQADGKIVAAGWSNAGASNTMDFAIARYDSTGMLDPSFGVNGDGQVTTDFFLRNDFGEGVAVDAAGNIVVAGQAYGTNGLRTFALVRYTPGGLPDATFGVNGRVTSDFFGYGSAALAVAVDATSRIVAVGLAQGRRSRDVQFAIARYTTAGALDTTFDGDGLVTTAFSGAPDVASAVVLDSSGNIVVGGQSQDKNFAVARYLP